jgi:hypothetical protein
MAASSQLLHPSLLSAPSWSTIVGIPDDNDVAGGHGLAPGVHPAVEDVVQVHVGEQRGNDAPYAKGNFAFDRTLRYR